MFRAINVVLSIYLAFERNSKKTRQEIVLEYLLKYHPEGKELYQKVLPKSPEQALTCLHYAYLQNLKYPGGKIYYALRSKNEGMHFIYVFKISGKLYYIEPNMIEDKLIPIAIGESVKNAKYEIRLDSIEDEYFSTTTISALKNEFKFDFVELKSDNYTDLDYLGFVSLQQFEYPKTLVYLSNRFSDSLEAIILKDQKDLVFVLPANKDNIELLNNNKIRHTKKEPSLIFTLNIKDLISLKSFIETKFGLEIYEDLTKFKENIILLNQIQSLYAKGVSSV